MKTVLRYAGGKSRAIKKITPFVEPYDTIVSPFIGGGSVFIKLLQECENKNINIKKFILNDKNSNLILLYNSII